MTDADFQCPGGKFHLGERTDKSEHEGMGTYARIKITHDADNADQKVNSL